MAPASQGLLRTAYNPRVGCPVLATRPSCCIELDDKPQLLWAFMNTSCRHSWCRMDCLHWYLRNTQLGEVEATTNVELVGMQNNIELDRYLLSSE